MKREKKTKRAKAENAEKEKERDRETQKQRDGVREGWEGNESENARKKAETKRNKNRKTMAALVL